MTDLQIYLIVAPLVLLLVGALAAWLGPKLIERAGHARQRGR
jgi:hypothetical protein